MTNVSPLRPQAAPDSFEEFWLACPALMRYLCRLVTPPGGTVLDPFAGTGTTGQAAIEEGFKAILIEREPEYCDDIRRRLGSASRQPDMFIEKPKPPNRSCSFDSRQPSRSRR